MKKPKFYSLIAVIACSIFCLSWKFFGFKDEALKARVDEYLNSQLKEPGPKLISDLRNEKYKALDWLASKYWKEELNYSSYRSNKKFLALFDKVSGQKDAISSQLFWYSNTEDALAEAKAQNKPVLCLQMLGDLSEDFSCANSRFFRTLLYSNKEVSTILKDKYILCWESVIKVPKITIEYPDGKKQIQTITGNSAHLVLNSDGQILDALPGLYGPTFFKGWLNNLCDADYVKNIKSNQKEKVGQLLNYKLIENLNNEDWSDILNEKPAEPLTASQSLKATEMTVAKSSSERPVYTSVFSVSKKTFKKLPPGNKEAFSSYKAFGYEWENPSAETKKLVATKKNYSPDELSFTYENIADNLTKENVRNDVRLHLKVLMWLQNRELSMNKKEFVNRIYKELFLTPLDDNKMGLYDRSLFSATTDDGFLEE